ncbi:hypothetical protein, partial [Neisseria gonorrhoeae]|uniref:hypothetical protein n=1 Tax=Neisseria gonorrhoeae TaxID=485 RepID=UPI001BFCC523
CLVAPMVVNFVNRRTARYTNHQTHPFSHTHTARMSRVADVAICLLFKNTARAMRAFLIPKK